VGWKAVWSQALKPTAVKVATDEKIGKARAAAEEEVEAFLAAGHSEAEAATFLGQAQEGYEEQDRRNERSERRATTLLGSTAVITAVLGASGGILAGSDVLEHGILRILVAALLVLAIAWFAISARLALLVVVAGDHWRRPFTRPTLKHRGALEGRALYVHSVAAFLDSIAWNQKIADRKARQVRLASNAFGVGLGVLVATAAIFLVLTALFPTG
jgi:hypothetical protein